MEQHNNNRGSVYSGRMKIARFQRGSVLLNSRPLGYTNCYYNEILGGVLT